MKTIIMTKLLAALPGATQTAAELLQKGIYAQETAGDLDAESWPRNSTCAA